MTVKTPKRRLKMGDRRRLVLGEIDVPVQVVRWDKARGTYKVRFLKATHAWRKGDCVVGIRDGDLARMESVRRKAR